MNMAIKQKSVKLMLIEMEVEMTEMVNCYVALVSETGGRRGRGDEFPGRLERTPNFSGDGRLGTAII